MSVLAPRPYFLRLGVCVLGLVSLLLLSPGIGTESGSFGWWDAWRARLGIAIDPAEIVGRPWVDVNEDGVISEQEMAGFTATARYIGFRQRLPRTLLALQVGVTLALCGATFQILFRNSLATPYTLGIASGGSLGALIAIQGGWVVSMWGFSTVSLAAFLGCLGVVAAVVVLARGGRGLTSNEMLLAGVTMGLFCSAMMMLVTVVSSEQQVFEIVRWMMGSLDSISPAKSATLLPLVLPAWVVLLMYAGAFNQYRLGDELSAVRGVHVARLRGLSVFVCTLATAGVVGQCGPIGFVGLVVPHMAALLFGPDCRILLPASALMGGAFLVLSDWAAQWTMRVAGWAMGRQLGSATLPIGVVTAVVGVPLFLIMLRARRGR